MPVGPILASKGIAVKDLTPEVTICPFCRGERLSIYADPATGSLSRWIYCPGCGWRGDSIEMYARCNQITDLREALYRTVREGLFTAPLQEVPPEAVNSYVEQYPERRRQDSERWRKLSVGLTYLRPEMVSRMQRDHLWGGWRFGYQHKLRQFLGGGARSDVVRFFNDSKVLPKDGFNTVLAFNYQDVPGRSTAFQFVGEGERAHLRFLRGTSFRRAEGGLAMLEALRPWEKTVYAVGDPVIALQLHRRHLADFDDPIKLVAYNESTDLAWRSVIAERVIFWAPKVDASLFLQARKVPQGYITLNPHMRKTAGEPYDYLGNLPTAAVLDMMERNAKPWEDVFIHWLTRREMEDTEAREFVARMGFSTKERNDILERCKGQARARLQGLLTETQAVQSILLNGKHILDKPDGWYVSYPSRGEELISDAVVRLVRIKVDPERRQISWEGYVRCGGKEIRFHDDLAHIERDPEAWLKGILSTAGLTATFNSIWASQLLNMARRFSEPRHEEVSSRLGIHGDGGIVFPRFTIRSGLFEESPSAPPGAYPAASVVPPRTRKRGKEDLPSKARAVWLANACAYVANFLQSLNQLPPAPIACAGAQGSAAHAAARAFARGAGMPSLTLDRGNRRMSIDDVRGKFNTLGYPTYLETLAPGLLRGYPALNSDHVCLSTGALEVAALAVGGRWWTIWAPENRPEANPLPPFDDVLLYLADLQTRNYELPGEACLPHAVAEDLSAWYARYLGLDAAETLAEVKKVFAGPALPGDAIVGLYCHLHRAGFIEVDHQPFSAAVRAMGIREHVKKGIIIDDVQNNVYLSRKELMVAVAKAHLPLPEVGAVSDDLIRRKLLIEKDLPLEGWIVPKDCWDRTALAWRQKLQA